MTLHEAFALLQELAELRAELDAADQRSIDEVEFAALAARWQQRTAMLERAVLHLQHGAGSLH